MSDPFVLSFLVLVFPLSLSLFVTLTDADVSWVWRPDVEDGCESHFWISAKKTLAGTSFWMPVARLVSASAWGVGKIGQCHVMSVLMRQRDAERGVSCPIITSCGSRPKSGSHVLFSIAKLSICEQLQNDTTEFFAIRLGEPCISQEI